MGKALLDFLSFSSLLGHSQHCVVHTQKKRRLTEISNTTQREIKALMCIFNFAV